MTITVANLAQMRALIARCQRDGVRMVLQAGWDHRDAGGTFGPWASGLLHHDASTTRAGTWGSLGIIVTGRSGIPGPLAQCQAARGDIPQIAIVGAARANHAGAGGPLRLVSDAAIPTDSYNRWGLGLEVANNGVDEPYSDATLHAVETWAYHVNELADVPAPGVDIYGHREWTTRKIDPRYDMDWMRRRIAAHQPGQPLEDDMALSDADKQWIADLVRDQLGDFTSRLLTSIDDGTANSVYNPGPGGTLRGTVNQVADGVADLAEKISQLQPSVTGQFTLTGDVTIAEP